MSLALTEVQQDLQPADQQAPAVGAAAVVALGRDADAALEAITLFGGIGFTWEHDVHLYWRRALSIQARTGSTEAWPAEVGAAALDGRRDASIDIAVDDPEFRARVAEIVDLRSAGVRVRPHG
ncbi:hypothetical protein [Nocardia sp. alder85J]|uniref:hypothetical protein n=1 Tax=Nocardia sp. alder85J TaxID=2862949 RepID=UPI001CD6FCB2|nr:hypothetical protein [Nocardia sp. alder85J]MCX4091591.1 hypothetical protein [Nocardia sp. alder85J]